MTEAIETSQPNNYSELARRAYLFLEKLGGRASEEALIQGVFGVRGKLEIWGGILRQVLTDENLFQRLPGGDWVLRTHTDPKLALHQLEYVVIDTETTGLNPHRSRMIEIAAIKLRGGQQVGTFQSLLNPHRRIPGFISKMTGISDEMTAAAPGFGKVVDRLMEFVGTAIIVGHNITFDMRFLNHELGLLRRPSLVNETVDTIGLAVRLFPGLKRPNLDRLAGLLGIPAKNRHRAYGDASITSDAFLKLLDIAGQHGFNTLEDLRNGRVKQASLPIPQTDNRIEIKPEQSLFESETLERPERIRTIRRNFWQEETESLTNRATAHARDILSRDLLQNLPEKPGVYLMKEASGKIIYVGKAKNLRERVSSYYSQPLGYTRKMDGLIESIAQIDHIETGSELEALLLESRLIKKYQPRYNTLLRNYEAYPFIKIDIGLRFPRVQACREILDDGARYFGPFKSLRSVEATINVIEQMFPVRNCTRSFEPETLARQKKAKPPCLRLHTNRCPGPCTGAHFDQEHAEYMKIVEDVINFLSGEKEAVLDEIWRRINRAIGDRNFEKAAGLRDALAQVQRIIASQEYLARAVESNHMLICLPSTEKNIVEVLCIFSGRLGRQVQLCAGDELPIQVQQLHQTWQELTEQEAHLAATQPGWGKKGGRVIGQDAVDEINIISRWIYAHSGDPGLISVPRDNTFNEEFWRKIIGQIGLLGII